MRRVTDGERAFLRHYFGDSLNVARIHIGSSLGRRSWSPVGGRISLVRELFHDRDPRAEVRLDVPAIAAVFAHEALHVWQRQHGRWVTWEGARLQAGYALGWFDPYAYDTHATCPDALLSCFVCGNIEQQGRIFEDYVRADLAGHDTTRFGQVAGFVLGGPSVRHVRR